MLPFRPFRLRRAFLLLRPVKKSLLRVMGDGQTGSLLPGTSVWWSSGLKATRAVRARSATIFKRTTPVRLTWLVGCNIMNPLFMATPSESDISEALALWPELAGQRVRPLLVSAFGDIYVETEAGEVWVAAPIDLACVFVAGSVQEFQQLFTNAQWKEEWLMTEFALLADEHGIKREPHQVFAFAPHPCFIGSLRIEQLMPMDINVWHDISKQLKDTQAINEVGRD